MDETITLNSIQQLVGALKGLVGDTGLHEDDCECDNTHEQNNTVCLYCYARQVLYEHSKRQLDEFLSGLTQLSLSTGVFIDCEPFPDLVDNKGNLVAQSLRWSGELNRKGYYVVL